MSTSEERAAIAFKTSAHKDDASAESVAANEEGLLLTDDCVEGIDPYNSAVRFVAGKFAKH